MITPGQLYEKIKKLITTERLQILISVFLFGLLAHAFVFFNYLPNWDGLNNWYSSQNTISLGRCFLTLACGISSYYDLPWINGILSLLYLGVTAILICELLQLQKASARILLGGLLAAFPAVTSIFAYMYTADGYFLSMLCMTAAIYLVLKHKWGFLPGALLITFAFGCYQAFITFAMMLVIVWSLKQLLFDCAPVKTLLLKWGRCLLSAVIGFLLYYLLNAVLQKLQHVTFADYQGISDLSASSPAVSLLQAAGQCITDFAYFFTGSLSAMNLYSYLNILMLLLLAIGMVFYLVQNKLWHTPARLLLTVLFAVLIPFCCFAIYFISPNVSYHMLMHGGLYFVYVLLLIFYDQASKKTAFFTVIYQWFCLILTCLILYNFILTANICYQKQNISVQASMNTMDHMAQVIMTLEDLKGADEIAVIGTLDDNPHVNPEGQKLSSISIHLPPDMTGFTEGYIMTGAVHYSHFLQNYYHLEFSAADEARTQALSADPEVARMPVWPESGSITIIDKTVIIKLSNE